METGIQQISWNLVLRPFLQNCQREAHNLGSKWNENQGLPWPCLMLSLLTGELSWLKGDGNSFCSSYWVSERPNIYHLHFQKENFNVCLQERGRWKWEPFYNQNISVEFALETDWDLRFLSELSSDTHVPWMLSEVLLPTRDPDATLELQMLWDQKSVLQWFHCTIQGPHPANQDSL